AQAAAQTSLNLNVLVKSDEVFRGVDFQNLRRVSVNINSNFSDPLKLGGNVSVGRSIARNLETPRLGQSLNLNVWGTVKPTSRLVLEPEFTFSSLHDLDTNEEFFSGYIVRSRLNYQFNRRLFLRIVNQYNNFSDRFEVDPLLTYKINPFTAFYVGSTHDIVDFEGTTGFYQTQRQFFFKFQYLVRT
ncbi:MAG: hypothetical protein HKN43_15105, partial [Rhodothermales bacterium]|nr:hypothetical protein [Rhodothermales bacterium]